MALKDVIRDRPAVCDYIDVSIGCSAIDCINGMQNHEEYCALQSSPATHCKF
jgi:hypothetical protein